MDNPEKVLAESLESIDRFIQLGNVLIQRKDYLGAIQVFTEGIENGLNMKDDYLKIANMMDLPPELKSAFLQNLQVIYVSRANSYYSIGEKEKGNADMIMAEKVKNSLNVPSQCENHKLNNSIQTPPAEQSTNSSNESTSDKVAEAVGCLFWLGALFFILKIIFG